MAENQPVIGSLSAMLYAQLSHGPIQHPISIEHGPRLRSARNLTASSDKDFMKLPNYKPKSIAGFQPAQSMKSLVHLT